MKLPFSLSLLLLFHLPCGGAEESHFLTVKTEVLPSTTVTVGEKIQIAITITSSEKIRLSTFSLPPLESFQLLNQNFQSFRETGDGKWEGVLSIELFTLAVGEFEFPQLHLPYQNSSSQKFDLQTPSAKIKVTTGLSGEVSPELLRDIQGPVSVSFWSWIFFLLFLCLTVVAVFWLLHHFRKKKSPISLPLTPVLPPHELALQKLEECHQRFERDGNTKLFFTELSFIFRSYLNARYLLDAEEKTTTEIFSEMRALGIERKLCLEAKEILAFSDLVKFAKFQPSSSAIDEQYERLKAWISATAVVLQQEQEKEVKV